MRPVGKQGRKGCIAHRSAALPFSVTLMIRLPRYCMLSADADADASKVLGWEKRTKSHWVPGASFERSRGHVARTRRASIDEIEDQFSGPTVFTLTSSPEAAKENARLRLQTTGHRDEARALSSLYLDRFRGRTVVARELSTSAVAVSDARSVPARSASRPRFGRRNSGHLSERCPRCFARPRMCLGQLSEAGIASDIGSRRAAASWGLSRASIAEVNTVDIVPPSAFRVCSPRRTADEEP